MMFVDINGLEYIPLREVAYSQGYSIQYNSEIRTAFIFNRDKKLVGTFTDGLQGTYISTFDQKMYIWVDENVGYANVLGVPNKESGYIPPKGGGRHWDKEKKGWIDKNGNIWVPDKSAHGGDHWDVQYPHGGYDNVYPDGTVREGKGKRGQFSPISINVHSDDVEIVDNLGKAGAIAVGAIVIYEGVKWGVAIATALPTGGSSLGLAAVTP